MYDNATIDHNIRLSTLVYVLTRALEEIEQTETIENARAFATDALDLSVKIKGE